MLESEPEKKITVLRGDQKVDVQLRDIIMKSHVRIESVNNFATAAGLASSASGLACLARCLAAVYDLEESFDGEFSMFARMGSGSACRSLYGGVVEWQQGFDDEEELKSEDNLAEISKRAVAKKICFDQLDYWVENLRVLICVVKPEQG